MSNQKKILRVKENEIKCIFRRSKKAKYMRLEISPSGELLAVRPRWVNAKIMEKFIESKASWILSNLEKIQRQKKDVSIFHTYDKENYIKNKKKAFEYISQKVFDINKIYNFKFNKISIRNQKTRWGSCSGEGNLSFNYKILFLPEYLAEYVVAHELCHLWEMNHSERFWRLVSKAIPDYKERRKRLRSI